MLFRSGAHLPGCLSSGVAGLGARTVISERGGLTLLSWCKSCGSIYIHPHEITEESHTTVIVSPYSGADMCRIAWPSRLMDAERTTSTPPVGVEGASTEAEGVRRSRQQADGFRMETRGKEKGVRVSSRKKKKP